MKRQVEDNKVHFQVTAGIVWEKGKVLIARRPQGKHMAGLWEFPGGKQEKDESLETCLKREMQEELGLKVKVEEHLLTVEHEYEDRIITLYVFSCTYSGKGPEHREYEEFLWVSPEELKNFDFPPPDRKILEFLERSWWNSERGGSDVL